MSRHPYTLLDVFTDRPLAGNGLAVVHDADGVADDVMLAFARETKLMETTFVQSASEPAADYRNRIWTVAEEVPFAGHPSLGTAVAVAARRGDEDVVYHQQTRAGIQEVTVRRNGDRARASVLQEPADSGPEVDPAAAMAAVGLDARDAHPTLTPQRVSTGLPALIAPVADRNALARANPEVQAIAALNVGVVNYYLCWVDPEQGSARARSSPAGRSSPRTLPPARPPDRSCTTCTSASASSASRSRRASRWGARAACSPRWTTGASAWAGTSSCS